MSITETEKVLEEKYLEKVLDIIQENISSLGQELYDKEEKIREFKELIWDSRHDMDPTEMRTMIGASDLEVTLAESRSRYFQKLYRIQEKPYFGVITFNDSETNKEEKIYIGITHVDEELKHYVYDWRAPICSMFYDYGVGDASYLSPEGIIKGTITNKRQFKIEHKKLIHIFDNNLNIDDEVLQEVLSKEANDKMKNIVNTIQQEQNEVIRNIENKTLIVQGIAGSGKTSVALHRIAFLLYKIKNLSSNNILIFSPNKVFSEYISNVLPELGEDNTLQTTFDSFLESNILEFRHVESFSRFIERYYKETEKNIELVKYKQSDRIINDLDQYIKSLEEKAEFISDIKVDKMYCTKDELNILLKRYNHFLLFDRIPAIASKLCDYYENGKHTKLKRIIKELYNAFNVKRSFKEIYKDFYRSKYFPNIPITEREIEDMMNKKEIKYEDACVFCYLKGLLEGFEYRGLIKQVVIDEAQDYNQLQYHIIKKIFPKSGFTILGDVNQTINPYYKYKTLEVLTNIFNDNVKYLELKKTYRSSEEIIEYTNKILGLEHIQAIRKKNQHPVLLKREEDITKQLIKDINRLKQESKSIAIITKTDTEANDIFKQLENEVKGISLLTGNDSKFNRDLVVVPSYIAKGLEFDSVIIYTTQENKYKEYEKNLYYVACTRAQHQLIIYNQ